MGLKPPEDGGVIIPDDEEWDDEDGEDEAEDEAEAEAGDSMGIAEFLELYKDPIARTVTDAYRPRYQPTDPAHRTALPRLLRPPMGSQEHALRGAVMSLTANAGTLLVGEMGTGKTYIGGAAAYMAGLRNILVVCPPHLVRKWKREIEMTVPGAEAGIVRRITDLRRLRMPGPG